jgi:hypothetical protein
VGLIKPVRNRIQLRDLGNTAMNLLVLYKLEGGGFFKQAT